MLASGRLVVVVPGVTVLQHFCDLALPSVLTAGETVTETDERVLRW